MKIVVAVDKSEESQQALRYTCHLLEHFTAIVDALYVKPDVVESTEGAYAPFTTKSDVERDAIELVNRGQEMPYLLGATWVGQGGEERERAAKAAMTRQLIGLMTGEYYAFIPLNGGSETRREMREYYRDFARSFNIRFSACGASVTLKVPEGDSFPRHVCEACNTIHYSNPNNQPHFY